MTNTDRSNWVVGIDPGYRTGLAVFDGTAMSGLELPLEESYLHINDLIRGIKPAQVICESFRITATTARNTQAPWSLELIGATRLVCLLTNTPFTLQAPGDAKGFASDDKLKALGWYTATKGGHQNDAARHLLVWLVKNGWWNPRLAKENR